MFVEDWGWVFKFIFIEVVEILKEEVFDVVKYYFEYFVFGKGNIVYVNDLIVYYLDVVVNDLGFFEVKWESIMVMYDVYWVL